MGDVVDERAYPDRMDDARYLVALERDAAALLAAARSADPETTIAACPEWTPVDLAWHIGKVHRFWAKVAGERLQEPPGDWPPARPDGDHAVFEWAAESAQLLQDALTTADRDEPVWSWSPHQHIAFVIRRMAQETAVHRADAEVAAGNVYRIEAELAADGIDEYLELFLAARLLGGRVHIHCTDADGEWTITPDDEGQLVVTRDHTKADAALRGPASDLLLTLWRRTEVEDTSVEVLGDAAVAARFLAATDHP